MPLATAGLFPFAPSQINNLAKQPTIIVKSRSGVGTRVLLKDELHVFVKRLPDSKVWADLAINDLVMSAKMSAHSNVLNPIGCCLETPSPVFVYEFAANGFLMDRIYVSRVTKRKNQPMAWMSRLKIARHIAYAISYLHTAFHRPVINWLYVCTVSY